MKAKIKENKDLVRDIESKAVVNTNFGKLMNAKISKKARLAQQDTINNLVKDIDDIKLLLNKLLNKEK